MPPIYTTVPITGGAVDPALSQKVQQLETWKTSTVDPTLTDHAGKINTVTSTATGAKQGVDTLSGQVDGLTTRLNANDAKDSDQDKLAWTGGTR